MTTTTIMLDDCQTLRRKAASAMLACVAQNSPSHAAFRIASREYELLMQRLKAGWDIGDELLVVTERLLRAADDIQQQWAALFDARGGRCNASPPFNFIEQHAPH